MKLLACSHHHTSACKYCFSTVAPRLERAGSCFSQHPTCLPEQTRVCPDQLRNPQSVGVLCLAANIAPCDTCIALLSCVACLSPYRCRITAPKSVSRPL